MKDSRKYKIGLTNVNDIVAQLQKFTEVYREEFEKDRFMCEARCTREQLPVYFDNYKSGDLFVGRASFSAIGFSPQVYTKRSGFGYFVEEEEVEKLLQVREISKENTSKLFQMKNFWLEKDSVNLTRQTYPDWVRKTLPSDNWTGESGIAFPLYRMGGTHLNYNKLVSLGIEGLRVEISKQAEVSKTNPGAVKLYEAMLFAMDTFTILCDAFIDSLKDGDSGGEDQKERALIMNSLRNIRKSKPNDFHEAIQLFYLFNVLSGSQNYGRIDDFLGEFLVNDLKQNRITEDEALGYLVALFQLMESRGTVYDGRAIIGGKGRKNEQAANKFALLAMKAIKKSATVLPQLTLRFYKGQDSELYNKALDNIGDGCVYPMLYNDDVNIPSVVEAFGFNMEEAEQYIPYGCGEYTLYHRSADTPSGIINLAKALEVIIHGGKDPLNGKKIGIGVDFKEIKSFQDLLRIYKKQVEYHLEALAWQQRQEYKLAADLSPFLYFSILYDSCIEKGIPIYDGGIDYLGGTMETYGNTVAADSLYAIKKMVFDENQFSIEQLSYMLAENFKGFEKERLLLKDLPKYGNDHKEADELYCELHDHICNYTRSLARKYDLHHYLVVIINNDANTDLGFHTGASADGRKSGKSLNNGNAPSPGNDQTGLTAFLNSIVKPRTDIHAGAVQNIKFSKEMFKRNRLEVEAALRTYFKQGGAQAMITVVGREDLEKALENPEDYKNLMVRVGGFSARFVDLRPEVQQEILNRTLY
jgi:pyruvate-formate lyase